MDSPKSVARESREENAKRAGANKARASFNDTFVVRIPRPAAYTGATQRFWTASKP